MVITFDLPADEAPIFLAEAEEQLQALDEGFVRLEREADNPDLQQVLFRAAHTLKGSSGAIGHRRMAELTHALENMLDGLRRGTLTLSADHVDAMLETLDALRGLLEEVTAGETSPVDSQPLIERLHRLAQAANGAAPAQAVAQPVAPTPPAAVKAPAAAPSGDSLVIAVECGANAFASAARAFQCVLALQDLGEVSDQAPTQAQIDLGTPVQRLSLRLACNRAPADIYAAMAHVPDVERFLVNGQAVYTAAPPAPPVEKPAETPASPAKPEAAHPNGASTPANTNGAKAHHLEKTVRTSVERLDSLMNLVGELITDRNRLTQLRDRFEKQSFSTDSAESLGQLALHLGRITDQLQEEVMRIRMLPIANVFNKYPRTVRDLARKVNKQVELVIRGEDTELDRTVVEEISDPLLHLLRNAVDHGLEVPADRVAAGKAPTGKLLLTARHEEGRILVTVEDDGRGLDMEAIKASALRKGQITEAEAAAMTQDEAIQLIFLPGLSTAKQVTDISGRGVGMDIVRTNLERLNGTIAVETWPGRGTRFEIGLPLTLAIVSGLLVQVNRPDEDPVTFAVPLTSVMEALRVKGEAVHLINHRPVVRHRGQVLPLMRLADTFGLPEPWQPQPGAAYDIVAVRWGKTQLGLMVDALVGEQDVVIKSLGPLVGDTVGVSGAVILGDGQVALVVDVPGLVKLAGGRGQG